MGFNIGSRYYEAKDTKIKSAAAPLDFNTIYASREKSIDRYGETLEALGDITNSLNESNVIAQSPAATAAYQEATDAFNVESAEGVRDFLVNKDKTSAKLRANDLRSRLQSANDPNTGRLGVFNQNAATRDAYEKKLKSSAVGIGDDTQQYLLSQGDDQYNLATEKAIADQNYKGLTYDTEAPAEFVNTMLQAQTLVKEFKLNTSSQTGRGAGLIMTNVSGWRNKDQAFKVGMNYTYTDQKANAFIRQSANAKVWKARQSGNMQEIDALKSRVPTSDWAAFNKDFKQRNGNGTPTLEDEYDYAMRYTTADGAKQVTAQTTHEQKVRDDQLWLYDQKIKLNNANKKKEEDELARRNSKLANNAIDYSKPKDGKETSSEYYEKNANPILGRDLYDAGNLKKKTKAIGGKYVDAANYTIDNPIEEEHIDKEILSTLKKKYPSYSSASNPIKGLMQMASTSSDTEDKEWANNIINDAIKNPNLYANINNVDDLSTIYDGSNSYKSTPVFVMTTGDDMTFKTKAMKGTIGSNVDEKGRKIGVATPGQSESMRVIKGDGTLSNEKVNMRPDESVTGDGAIIMVQVGDEFKWSPAYQFSNSTGTQRNIAGNDVAYDVKANGQGYNKATSALMKGDATVTYDEPSVLDYTDDISQAVSYGLDQRFKHEMTINTDKRKKIPTYKASSGGKTIDGYRGNYRTVQTRVKMNNPNTGKVEIHFVSNTYDDTYKLISTTSTINGQDRFRDIRKSMTSLNASTRDNLSSPESNADGKVVEID